MPTVSRRALNEAVTRFWSFAAPGYNLPVLQRWVYRPAHDEVIARLHAHSSRRIADIGCGTGILADRIKRELQTEEVFGVDMSRGMLDQARSRSDQVQWLRGPAEQLPFGDAALDAVVTTSAFHFFDQAAALREFSRVLRPGGLVAVAALSAQLPGAAASTWMPVHQAPPGELRSLFQGAGLTIREQHRIPRPVITRFIADLITVGIKE
jgi:ubiquinone/menaquinone biosynthesis C-methylase UbiE